MSLSSKTGRLTRRRSCGRGRGAGTVALVLGLGMLAGCQVARIPDQTLRVVTGQTDKSIQDDPSILQQDIFRFCDEFGNRMSVEIDRLLRKDPRFDDSALVRLKLKLNYRLLETAAGANDYVNLCDLVCLVSMCRYVMEQDPFVIGAKDEGRMVIEVLKNFEERAFALAEATFGPETNEDLRKKVAAWVPEAYVPGAGLSAHYSELPREIGQLSNAADYAQMNLLGALMLDPLAGLDPTRREIAKTRLFAERAMYVSQRMPKIIRMEGELVSYRLIETPQIQDLLEDVDSVTQSIDRATQVAQGLPETIRAEREAVLAALEEQTPEMTKLVGETRATADATAEALAASRELVESVDRFLERLGVYEENPHPDPAGEEAREPFRIQDYTEAAEQLGVTAEKLNILVAGLDDALASVASDEFSTRMQSAVQGGRDLINFVFWKAVLLIAVACILVSATIVSIKLLSGSGQIE